jgi:AraC-like DNA-binding protein
MPEVMPEIEKLRLRTADLDEAVDAVTRVYCPHSLHFHGSNRGVSSELEVSSAGPLRIVDLKYSAPVHVDAGDFKRLMLMMSCTGGSAWARQGRSEASWMSGQTLPLSPDVSSQLAFDADFAQRSVRVDLALLDELCARRLGRGLDDPVRFLLTPFSRELEKAWQSAMNLALGYEAAGIALPPRTAKAFDEFMLSLLLDLAPHNYSDDIKVPHPVAAPRMLREAERLMREADGVASVHEIAAALAISVRSLEAGFREWKHETPVAFMRRLRLAAAREQLSNPGARTTVADVALSCGFLHLSRFAQYYRAAFNEHPGETLRSARRRVPCASRQSIGSGSRVRLDAQHPVDQKRRV